MAAAAICAAAAACSKSNTSERTDEAAEQVRDQTEEVRASSQEVAERARDTAGQAQDTVTDSVEEIGERSGVDRGLGASEDPATDPIVEPMTEPITDRQATAPSARDPNAQSAREDLNDLADEERDLGQNARALEEATNEFEYQRLTRIQTLRAVHGVAAAQPALINALAAGENLTDNGRLQVDTRVQELQQRIDQAGNLIQGLRGVDAQNWEARNDAVVEAMERVEDTRAAAWKQLEDADRLDQTSMAPMAPMAP